MSLCLFQGPRRGSHADQGHWNCKSWEENPGIFHGDRLHFRRVLPGHPPIHLLHFCLDQSKYPGILLVHEGKNTYLKFKDWSNFQIAKNHISNIVLFRNSDANNPDLHLMLMMISKPLVMLIKLVLMISVSHWCWCYWQFSERWFGFDDKFNCLGHQLRKATTKNGKT